MDYNDSRYVASIGGDGIVREQDVRPLKKGVQLIYDIMKDGKWHTIPELRNRIHQEGADRRMRELRQAGITVEKRRVGDSRIWEYRIQTKQQGSLW